MKLLIGLILLLFAGLAIYIVSAHSLEAHPAVSQVGAIQHKPIDESSGIVASRNHPGVYWTHNDRGGKPVIYAITREGRLIAEFRTAFRNDDWEDIAADDQGRLYIGRIGNNDARKQEIQVYRITEPDPFQAGPSRPIRPERTWVLRYPDVPFDAESLFVHGGYAYLISKMPRHVPATLYRFPLADDDDPRVLEKVTSLPIRLPVTAADLSSDARRLAVLAGHGLYVFPIEGDVARIAQVEPVFILLPPRQVEACCFSPDGVLITAESREIYFCPEQAYTKEPRAAPVE